ncbi:MAG: hypothetical protein M1330_03305 [Armatimonadetes bacterium]|nr:hypothetical protein [Armatimonadota bacterium]
MGDQHLEDFCRRLRLVFGGEAMDNRFRRYRRNPERFAGEVLSSHWWSRQRDIARSVTQSRRTVVKSANGVGKTYLAADLALWFLYCHAPSIVLTTAPTRRQVESLLWEEIRRRMRRANAELPGMLLKTRLQIREGWYALGLATDEDVRFQGFHAENLLVVMDEASGVPDEIWNAVEGVAVGRNNRVLAIGNPLAPVGRFYRAFRSPRWKALTVSALEHPNVIGRGEIIEGAVTRETIADRVAEWCEEVTPPAEGARSNVPLHGQAARNNLFEWEGHWYRPNDLFLTRVLGEFPEDAENRLILLRWIERAMKSDVAPVGLVFMAVDVARFGQDCSVIAVRRGPAVVRLESFRGLDLMNLTGRIVEVAREERPESIMVDVVGVGGGVVDRLNELGIEGVIGVNVGMRSQQPERFANLRAELYWSLRERLAENHIRLPSDRTLLEELSSLTYRFTSSGQVQMESKETMRRRGESSPDRADAVAMLWALRTEEGVAVSTELGQGVNWVDERW